MSMFVIYDKDTSFSRPSSGFILQCNIESTPFNGSMDILGLYSVSNHTTSYLNPIDDESLIILSHGHKVRTTRVRVPENFIIKYYPSDRYRTYKSTILADGSLFLVADMGKDGLIYLPDRFFYGMLIIDANGTITKKSEFIENSNYYSSYLQSFCLIPMKNDTVAILSVSKNKSKDSKKTIYLNHYHIKTGLFPRISSWKMEIEEDLIRPSCEIYHDIIYLADRDVIWYLEDGEAIITLYRPKHKFFLKTLGTKLILIDVTQEYDHHNFFHVYEKSCSSCQFSLLGSPNSILETIDLIDYDVSRHETSFEIEEVISLSSNEFCTPSLQTLIAN